MYVWCISVSYLLSNVARDMTDSIGVSRNWGNIFQSVLRVTRAFQNVERDTVIVDFSFSKRTMPMI